MAITKEIQTLLDAAQIARSKAYAPYSNFKVGAALYNSHGDIITGCNIENISFTPTVCAERTAIFSAISQGYKTFKALAVVTQDINPSPPCGVCRQVLTEFVSDDFPIILSNTSGDIIETTFGEIFPYRFKPFTSIGKLDVWDSLREIVLRDSVISDTEFNLIQSILEDVEKFEKFVINARKDGKITNSEEFIIKNMRDKIYERAYSKAKEDDQITDEEQAILTKLSELLDAE